MNESVFEFNRRAIRPIECLRGGWDLIKDEYWQFWGLMFVGLLIGGAAPFGVLLGPMMCGIDICLFRRMRGREVNFNRLFDGFQHFGPSFVATLFAIFPQMLLMVVGYIAMAATMLGFMIPLQQQARQQGAPPDTTGVLAMFGVQAVLMIAILGTSILIHALLFFTYPLIVDRRMTGMESVKTSVRACLGNLGGMIGFTILETFVIMLGMLAGCVGMYFVFPITLAETPRRLSPASASRLATW